MGTPNLGYPYITGDETSLLGHGLCSALTREMFGDFRNPASRLPQCSNEVSCKEATDVVGHQVTLSSFLYGLNDKWTSDPLTYGPSPNGWLAIAGTFCPIPNRHFLGTVMGVGCADSQPNNDGVVCEQSAKFNWVAPNSPARTLALASYAHTQATGTGALLFPCPTAQASLTSLGDPDSTVLVSILNFIMGQP